MQIYLHNFEIFARYKHITSHYTYLTYQIIQLEKLMQKFLEKQIATLHEMEITQSRNNNIW